MDIKDSKDISKMLDSLNTYSKEHNIAFAEKRKQRINMCVILVVEDDDFARTLLINSLKLKWECDILSAKNGVEAINNYISSAPDIVFLDIGLPDCSGIDLLKKFAVADNDSFIVMSTSSNSIEDVKSSINYGAKGYLVKPITPMKLEQHLKVYFNKIKNFNRK